MTEDDDHEARVAWLHAEAKARPIPRSECRTEEEKENYAAAVRALNRLTVEQRL